MPAGDEYEKLSKESAVGILGAVNKKAVDLGVACSTRHVIEKYEWKAIIQAAENNRCDLIHMGSHGRSGLAALILGSQTQHVLMNSRIPVLVCR